MGAVYRADLTGPNLTQQRACGSAVMVSDGAYGQLVAAHISLLAGCSAAIVTLSASSDLQRVANFVLSDNRLWLPPPLPTRGAGYRHVETKRRSRHSGLSYTPVNHPCPLLFDGPRHSTAQEQQVRDPQLQPPHRLVVV